MSGGRGVTQQGGGETFSKFEPRSRRDSKPQLKRGPSFTDQVECIQVSVLAPSLRRSMVFDEKKGLGWQLTN